MANNKKVFVPGQLEVVTVEGKLAPASQIYDENYDKFQSELNQEMKSITDQMQIAIDGGSVDLTSDPDDIVEGSGKVPNANAIAKKIEKSLNDIYDVSAHNDGATFASLEALLSDANLDTLIPTTYRKGGMIITFVQTSDNKYVQYRLMADSWSTNTKNWAIAEEGVYVENPEFIYVKTDAEDKILWAIKTDGTIYYGAGVPQQVIGYIQEKIAELSLDEYGDIVTFLGTLITGDKTLATLLNEKADKVEGKSLIDAEYATGISYVENPEFINVWTDSEDKILLALKTDGDVLFGYGVPSQVVEYVTEKIAEVNNSIADKDSRITAIETFLAGFTDTTLIQYLNDNYGEYVNDLENRLEIKTDSKERIISYRKEDGTIVENVGIETNKLTLTDEGMTDFQQALKDAGFNPGGAGDYSDTITEKGKKPVFIPTPRLARLNILWYGDLTKLSKAGRQDGVQKVNYDVKVPVEFFDGQGVYFKKYALMSAQGTSSMLYKEKNISLKFFDTEDVEGKKKKWGKGDTFGTVFGDWVMQKTYHLKCYYLDFLKGSPVVAYQLADEVYKTRGEYADRPWKKALIDFSEITSRTPAGLSEDGIDDINLQIDNGARCMPDGFPVIVYQNGEFYGIFCWQLKKDSDNFNLDTSKSTHIHLDGDLYASNLWGGSINWTQFEIRNPEDLVCMDGSDYDGDNPAELIDSTATGVYDPENENHVRSAQVKQYIIDLSTRVGEINALTPTYTRPDEEIVTLNTYKGEHDLTIQYNKGNWVKDPNNSEYYMCVEQSGVIGSPLTDTDHWFEVTSAISSVKAAFETYFDVDNMVDYEVINMALGDPDGFGKNWQWVTYDGIKWWVNQYDKDNSFGNDWRGMFTNAPRTGWIGNDTSLPTGLAIRYYTPEHKTRWNELVEKGLFKAGHINKLLADWVSRVGKANYEQNWKKWTQSPCNRDSKIDFSNWKFTGNAMNSTPTSGIWNSATTYSVNEVVWYKHEGEATWYLQFKAVASNTNKPCLTGIYTLTPVSMGYRDNIWRFFKYVEETLANQSTFINSLY